MRKILSAAMAAAVALSASAAGRADDPFRWTPAAQGAPRQWQQLKPRAPRHAAPLTGPTATLPPAHATGYVDAPDGSSWYYTMDYDEDILEQNEYYTDYTIGGVHITMYDQQRQVVGRVDASWDKPQDVGRIQSVQVGAAVTRKFFDSSDAYELMLMLNENPVEGYGARQRTLVYALTPDGAGGPLAEIPGYYISAVNTAQDSWSENFFILFCNSSTWPDQDSSQAAFTLYTKAGWNAGPKELRHWDLDMRHSYSDGENEGLPIIMNGHGNTLYVATALYEKTFFANPDDYEDETLSPDNHYLIHLYKSGWGNLEDLGETSIAVEAPDEGYFMRTYCVGQFLGAADMTFDFNDAGETLPRYIIRVNQTDYNEGTASYFAAYGHDGQETCRWGEGAASCRRLHSIEGQPEQFCFQTARGYEMMDYPSLDAGAVLPAALEIGGDMWPYSGDLDRARCRGGYKYAISLLNGDEDADGNTLHRVAWYDAEGGLDRVDALNVGPNVARVQIYMDGAVLDPNLLNTDDDQEYVVYVSRLLSDDNPQTQLHLCVTNASGEMLADVPFEENTSNINTSLVNADGHAALFYYYHSQEDGCYTPSFIDLPLNDFEGQGTVDNPYVLRTRGDMDRVRYNLNAHFRLGSDIDYDGGYMKCVTGEFTGSLDGDGHSINGPVIAGTGSNVAMFATLGRGADADGADQPQAFVRNLGINDARVVATSRNNGNVALLAADVANALVEDVRVNSLEISTSETPKCDVGGLIGNASLRTTVRSCRVDSANIRVPSAYHVGGIAANMQTGSVIEQTQLSGTIEGGKNVGGIVSTTADMNTAAAPGRITDCRVSADIKGTANVGGIIGDDPRIPLKRCVYSGSLEATEVQRGYYEGSYAPYDYLNVGGIAGRLSRAFSGTGDVVTGCVADVKAITVPDQASNQARQTVHRLVGWSSANDEPEILSETYNEETGDYDYVFGDPAPAEKGIKKCYAVADFAAPDPSLAVATGTEGESMERASLTQEFYEGLGYDFDLWTLQDDSLPALFVPGKSGIAAEEADSLPQGAIVYYDLSGRRVAVPQAGIYIKVQDGKATKVRILR